MSGFRAFVNRQFQESFKITFIENLKNCQKS